MHIILEDQSPERVKSLFLQGISEKLVDAPKVSSLKFFCQEKSVKREEATRPLKQGLVTHPRKVIDTMIAALETISKHFR